MGETPAWLLTIDLALIAMSFAAWGVVIWRRRGADGLLPFAPRRPVPWGPFAGTMLAGLLLFLTLTENLAPAPAVDPHRDESGVTASQFAGNLIAHSGVLAMLTVVSGLAVSASTGARPSDFGLPTSVADAAADVKLGVQVAALAFGPTLLVQFAAVQFFGTPSQHPILEQIANQGGWQVAAAAFVGAVLVGPVFEEFAFRLLLQGWLEKEEINWLAASTAGHAHESGDWPNDSASAAPSGAPPQPLLGNDPRPMSFGGMESGWWPVLLSAFAFALVHLGHGPDWLALYPFAVVLGYVYQRTHRLLPCVVAHMVFNSVMLLLALTAAIAGQG